MGALMTAYMYYQLFVLVVQIFAECDDDDYSLAQKRELEACVFVDQECTRDFFGGEQCWIEERNAYCCYNSPISRIIQEGAKAQLGTGFGDYNDLQCGGLTFETLGTLDWSLMDWSEWEAIMVQTGVMPDPTEVDIDVLTGTGSQLQQGHDPDPRPNAAERTQIRLNTLETTPVNRTAEQSLFPQTITNQ
jgi:conjugal transfer mating pair stabilization protein TraN